MIFAIAGLLIAIVLGFWVLRLVIGAVVLVVGVCLAIAVAVGAGMAVAMLVTLVGEAAQWRDPGVVGALLGALAFVGVLVLIARRVFAGADGDRTQRFYRPLPQAVPEPEPEPEPEEADAAVRAAWQRAGVIAPGHDARLRAARRDCAALLAMADGNGEAAGALDPAMIDLVVMIRRNLPALVQRVDALWQGAGAVERDELAQGLTADLERLGKTAAEALARQRALRDGFPVPLTLRVHRALSWLIRAEGEADDLDVRFILSWIGFNATYAGDVALALGPDTVRERDLFMRFFTTLVGFDGRHRLYDMVWQRFAQEIRVLLGNRHVFAPFWLHHNGVAGYADWRDRMERETVAIGAALRRHDTATLLSIVFGRLYVLRNQLVHGGATWNSTINRAQVRDGAAILGCLLPLFIDLMMDNPAHDWPMPHYPVVEG